MKIYVATSWRNRNQSAVVGFLRDQGHEVYDFKNPEVGDHGFHWSEIDPKWQKWSAKQFRKGLDHPLAVKGFDNDFSAMVWADACVLVLPCGRSAHLEAGWFVGAKKKLFIFSGDGTASKFEVVPELMYRMATEFCVEWDELVSMIKKHERKRE